GSAAVGSAAVGGGGAASPRYDWSGTGRAAGRASVPVSPGRPGGTATGRARVRPPGGPGGPGGPGDDDDDGRPTRRKKRRWVRNTLLSILAVMVMSAGGGMLALSYYVD